MTTRSRRTSAALAVLALALFSALVVPDAAAAATTRARASLLDIENDVMCTVCNEPLAVADSPEAYQERGFIRALIAKGETKAQIERQLVVQYGPAVLGRPPAHGFNLTVYVLPPAIVVLGVVVLLITLPRWRRRARAARAQPLAGAPPLDPAEESRLEEELSRYGG
ncbi:MAG TPA: cytochrome c-type biogenesis protein CcmH [Solirubrobacteraceae bacterium]|nr:cytochrome c-type biogenesis protein CcmH [Solirubrobacteraceae bacterium]